MKIIDLRTCVVIQGSRTTWPGLWEAPSCRHSWWSHLAFRQRGNVERIGQTLVRPESNQARHRLEFRALWKWPDRAALEGEFGSLSRVLDAGQKMVVEVG